jgi:hypothetical protein
MKKSLIAGAVGLFAIAVGLFAISGVALADDYSSTVTTQSSSANPGVVSTTRVDKSVGTENGMLTQRTDTYHAVAPVVPVQTTTTIEKSTTTSTNPDAQ